jgi:hypothetical protein
VNEHRSSGQALGGGVLLLLLVVLVLAIHTALQHVHAMLTSTHHASLPAWATPVGIAIVVSGAAAASLLVLIRIRATRRTLADRVTYSVLAADDFDPSPEAVLRAAAQLSRVRRAVLGWLDPRASAVRVRLDSGPDGRMLYRIEVARRTRSVVAAALGSLGQLELREDAGPETAAPGYVARAELILARPSNEALALVGLSPDPLQIFARAYAAIKHGEQAAVVIDLLPAAAAQRHDFRRMLLRQARHAEQGAAGLFSPFLLEAPGARRDTSLSEQIERRADARQLATKVLEHDPLFEAQILMRAGAESPELARAHLQALLSCFDAWSGQNWFRVAGLNLLGLRFWGADDTPWRRRSFDRRFRTGLFRPRRRNLVTAREIGALLKPPSKHCQAPNVVGLGGSIPPPPPGLPTFHGQRSLLPLGRINDSDRTRLVGVPLRDTFFCYMAGRSRYGKTETAINQFLHLVRSGAGGLFLDPHDDALQRIKAHLTEPHLARRVVEINLAGGQRDGRQIAWNLFSMAGRGADDAEKKVAAVVDSFSSVLGWDERASRAMNLITQTAQSLIELALLLPPELAPTLFTITSLLSNNDFRAGVIPHLSPPTRDFWLRRFPRLPGEAITPVTNLFDRMRASRAIAALFGAARSGYDIRRAMDEGKIVLACPGAGGLQQNRLVANLLVYDLLHAALTRSELAPERRRPFFAFIDEAQVCDGASNGNLAALLEQSAKFGLRLFLFNQDPERLTARTWSAIKTNRSHLMTTVVSAEAAVLLARQWGGDVAPSTITRLTRYSFVTSVTMAREISRPFLVHGVSVNEMWRDCHHPEKLAELEAIIDRSNARRPLDETLMRLRDHDERILGQLNATSRPTPGDGRPQDYVVDPRPKPPQRRRQDRRESQ